MTLVYGGLEMNDVYHYGVPGMRWGVRKKRQGSTKKQGRQTSHKNVSRTRARLTSVPNMLLFTGSITIAVWAKTHPKSVAKGIEFVNRALKTSEKIADSSGIFSKKLGRMLTIAEAEDLGLL